MPPSIQTRFDWRRLDWPLLVLLGLLFTGSWVALWSASQHGGGAAVNEHFDAKQLRWIALSSLAAAGLCAVPYLAFRNMAYAMYTLLLGLIVLVEIAGVSRYGAQRWLDFKFMLFQPSEFMKIALVLTLARFLMYRNPAASRIAFIAPFALTAVPLVMVMKQPDLGTSLIFLPILFTLLFVAGARFRHLGAIVLAGLIFAPIAYAFLLRDYQRERITSFLHPERYAQNESYQVIQSMDAVGSGQWLGKGAGQGSQNLLGFVPFKHNDFIFSVMGEEWGFLGCMAFLSIYLLFLLRCLQLAMRTREPFGRLLIVGITAIFASQLWINIGMALGLMPVTGMTLPFISYGGSSVLSSMLGVGLILNVAMRPVMVLKDEENPAAFDFTFDPVEARAKPVIQAARKLRSGGGLRARHPLPARLPVK